MNPKLVCLIVHINHVYGAYNFKFPMIIITVPFRHILKKCTFLCNDRRTQNFMLNYSYFAIIFSHYVRTEISFYCLGAIFFLLRRVCHRSVCGLIK